MVWIVAGDINLLQKLCCELLGVIILLIAHVTKNNDTHKCIVVYQLQQWLCERAAILSYTYITRLVSMLVIQGCWGMKWVIALQRLDFI